MKKVTQTIVMAIVVVISVFAQSPHAFKYQAVVRDNTGEITSNQTVSFRISIWNVTARGTIVNQEAPFK